MAAAVRGLLAQRDMLGQRQQVRRGHALVDHWFQKVGALEALKLGQLGIEPALVILLGISDRADIVADALDVGQPRVRLRRPL